MPRCDFAHVQYDVNLHILCMIEGTFSLDAALVYLRMFAAAANGTSKIMRHYAPASNIIILIVFALITTHAPISALSSNF